MLRMRVDIAGEVQYERGFQALEGELHDLREPLGDIADVLKQSVGEQFQSEGEHGTGGKWKTLSHPYDDIKEERYPGHPILVASGEMRRAFLVNGTRELDAKHLVWGVTDQIDEAEGSAGYGRPIRERASAHQSGEGVVPQRKIIALTNMERRDIDHQIAAWLTYKRRTLLPGARAA
jgi:hypothetical protein